MTTVEINLPDSISKTEAQLLLASKLFEAGRLSLGQAARLAGFSKRAFIEILGQQHISVFQYSSEELREELGL